MDHPDCIIIGGGLVGQTLALALAAHELAVTVIERDEPESHLRAEFDGRASAIASAPARMLRALGLGDVLDEQGCPIRAIRVTDGNPAAAANSASGAPRFLHFDSADAAPVEPLGVMVENRALRTALLARVRATAAQSAAIRLLAPASITAVDRTGPQARVTLADGAILSAPLVIAADGRRSSLRSQAGIRTAQWRYPATAIVTMFAHARPHDNVASELFYPTGPFAQLPMRDLPDGRHRSALVWTVDGTDASAVMALSPRALMHEVKQRMGGFLGELEQLAPASSYPLGLHHAERYWAERLILVGDAAHGIHPIAGQGLNMGLRDVAGLAQVLSTAARTGIDLGSPEVARQYEQMRRFDNSMTAVATDVLARLFGIPGRPAAAIRRFGLGLVNRTPPLKRAFMAVARGESGDLPPLLRGEIG